jgi:hypothetical protein
METGGLIMFTGLSGIKGASGPIAYGWWANPFKNAFLSAEEIKMGYYTDGKLCFSLILSISWPRKLITNDLEVWFNSLCPKLEMLTELKNMSRYLNNFW